MRIKYAGHHPKVKWEIVKKCIPYNQQTKRCRKVGNCYIQRTQPIKQKKRNRIQMPTPVEVRTR